MKYKIFDATASTGKNWIDENGDNCVEEYAEVFDTRTGAEQRVAQIDLRGRWSRIVPCEHINKTRS